MMLVLSAGLVAGCGEGADPVAQGFELGPSSTPTTLFLGETPTDQPTEVAGDETKAAIAVDPEGATAPGGGSPDGGSRVAPAGPTAALQANLTTFGSAFLSYDYRQPGDERTARLASVTTPELAAELGVPLPPDAEQKLVAERRVVSAEFISATAVDETVYELTFLVTVTAGDGEVLIEPELRTLIVTVNANGLITNVL